MTNKGQLGGSNRDEERYQAFIQNSSEGIWCCELTKPIPVDLPAKKQIELMYKYGYLSEANLAMAKMYGYRSTKPLIGLKLSQLLVKSDPRNTAYLRAFVESGYRLSGVESHEIDSKGRDKYFRNSLVGVVENGLAYRAWGTQQDITENYLAAEALAKSEERLDLALKASELGMWEWNLKTNALTWSPELKKIYGLRIRDKVNFNNYQQMIHPDDRAELQKRIEDSMKTGASYKVEHRVVWPNGKIHWVLGQGRAYIENGKPVSMAGTSMLIDERKKAESTLRRQNTYLETLHDTAVDTIRDIKQQSQVLETILTRAGEISDTEHGYIYMLTPEGDKLAVKVATGIFTKHIGHTIEFGEGLAGKVWKTCRTQTVTDYDNWKDRQKTFPKSLFKAAVGVPLWSGHKVIGVIALGHEQAGRVFDQEQITALERLADLASIAANNARLFQELQESEKRFRGMADTAPVLIWVADTTKKCTYFNKAWLDFTGRTMEEEYGDGWMEDIHPEDLKYCVDTYNRCFDARETYNMEYRLRRHDGAYRWIIDNGTPRFSPGGEFQGYIGSCMDIQEMKQADQVIMANAALKSQHDQLLALNKSKDEFISLASHQLRTPATGVKQYIGMLLEGYGGKLTKNQLHLLKTAYESNERQLNVIDDLLRVAHVDAGKVVLNKEKTNLVKLVKDVMREQYNTFAERNQRVMLENPKGNVWATIDSSRLRMVLENLIDNASKYSPPESMVTVRVYQTGSNVQIEIADQGVGIAKRDIQKLFQKFSRVNNSLSTLVGGTGIGLYWAKKIVDLHGGTIEIKSKLHKGTTFTIQLPQA